MLAAKPLPGSLVHRPFGRKRRGRGRYRLAPVQHRVREILDAGQVQVGVRRDLLRASRISQGRTVERGEIELDFGDNLTNLRLTVSLDYYHNVMVMLGEFEYLLLSSAARLGEGAYGAAIRADIQRATGRDCSIGALYTTLDRLQSKGLLRTWMGDPSPQRGGRPKRMVRITAKGIRAATEFYNTVTRVSSGVLWEAVKS